jgi:hypothetical protein
LPKTPIKRPKPPPREPQYVSGKELILSEVGGGVGSGRGLNERLRKELGIPYAFLTESQFKEIQSKAGLSRHARYELNIALRRYWISCLETKVSAETRNTVNLAYDKLEEALGAVATILSNKEFFNGPIEHFQHTPLEQSDMLEDTMASMMRAQKIIRDAQTRLSRGPGQPSYGPLYDLIRHLDFIFYESHGIVLKRSGKRIPVNGATDTPLEYVWGVVKVANLKVARSTVDTILANYIHDRDENDRMLPDRKI